MQENLKEMINTLNDDKKVEEEIKEPEINSEVETDTEETADTTPIHLTNFYDWYEMYGETIHNITRSKLEVANINSKDCIIFKIPKGKIEDGTMELVSFYNPSTRPIVNQPPVYMKIFKNDTFEVLHSFNEELLIKSYGVKTGLILVFCANVDGRIIPFYKTKVKKNATSIGMANLFPNIDEIREKLKENVDVESIQLLYKQAIKHLSEFTTKEKTLDWFLKKQTEVVDINHLLKIDNVLINVI